MSSMESTMGSQQGHSRAEVDLKERRREQNRIAQRKFREKSKNRLQSSNNNTQQTSKLTRDISQLNSLRLNSESSILCQTETSLAGPANSRPQSNLDIPIGPHSMVLDELEAGLPPMWEHLQIGNGGSSNSRDGSSEALISSTFLKAPQDGGMDSALTTLEYQRNELCGQADRLINKLVSIYDIGHSIGIFPFVPYLQPELDNIAETFQSLRLGERISSESNNDGQSE
ncbi:hypothetical protein DER46DRAFT_577332 [Fusarium sp. MPI-SDFR-AT-0072]|nr:hypothetical protein DER46DRAFT_577332 [Fusarium sp. MPI-SDFR-AT-0072]